MGCREAALRTKLEPPFENHHLKTLGLSAGFLELRAGFLQKKRTQMKARINISRKGSQSCA